MGGDYQSYQNIKKWIENTSENKKVSSKALNSALKALKEKGTLKNKGKKTGTYGLTVDGKKEKKAKKPKKESKAKKGSKVNVKKLEKEKKDNEKKIQDLKKQPGKKKKEFKKKPGKKKKKKKKKK